METVRNTLEQVEGVLEKSLEAAGQLSPMEVGLLRGNVFLCGLDNREKVIMASIRAVPTLEQQNCSENNADFLFP